ncbi:hypothetical protein IJZ97_03735 [bacterium]|nr:hypothetical protein [bacterium]
MGLNLNNVHQRPYIVPDKRNQIRRREEEEQSTSNAQKEQQTNENSKSKGLQYTQQNQQTPQSYQTNQNNFAYQQYQQQTLNSEPFYPNEVATALAQRNPNINIAQILKDFKNTAIAIGTPDDLKEEVNGYIELIEKQITKETPNSKLIKSNLKNAASILDNYISKTLDKDSKVVENWVDALFLQQIDFKYNENDINQEFLVKFPEETSNKEEKTKKEEPVNSLIPQDKELKKLFIQAKKMSYANKPKEAIEAFQTALERANKVNDKETQSKIFLEVGKIYDDHDYLAQALKSYNESVQRTSDCNVKTRAHYSMAEIYNDVNKMEPAIDHYFSTVSFAGEAENLSVQSRSLAKIGNIYTDMYEKNAFDYFEVADSIADETDNAKLKGYVSSSLGDAYDKFGESPEALKAYSKAVKNYIDADSPLKVAQNYYNAAEIMLEFKNEEKAKGLLEKAQKFARKTDNMELLTEINNTLISIS